MCIYTFRRLKTWLCTIMRERRLTGLALPNINRDIIKDVYDIITKFSNKKNKKNTEICHISFLKTIIYVMILVSNILLFFYKMQVLFSSE